MLHQCWFAAVAVCLILFDALASGPRCSNAIFPPLTYDRENWEELEQLKVSPPQDPLVVRRQDLQEAGHGKLNYDFFSITVDADGRSAEHLFREIKAKLNQLIFNGTTYSVAPANEEHAAIWKSDDPTGAILVFTLAEIPNVMPLERGGVFVSCHSETDMVFSTIELATVGLHPVAGNRAFGVHDHGNGSLSIYVKATDRVVDSGIYGILDDARREKVFLEGEKVWRRMLQNLGASYVSHNPRHETAFSRRVAY